jgi:formylmethanofuran dehydrogenase subunit A
MAPKLKGDGVEAASALLRAAQLLRRARFPVIGGLLSDIDGAAAALALAKKLFASAHLVFKDGALVVRDGEVVNVTWGKAYHVAPGVDAHIERRLAAFYDRYYGVHPSSFGVPTQIAGRPDRFATVPCLN